MFTFVPLSKGYGCLIMLEHPAMPWAICFQCVLMFVQLCFFYDSSMLWVTWAIDIWYVLIEGKVMTFPFLFLTAAHPIHPSISFFPPSIAVFQRSLLGEASQCETYCSRFFFFLSPISVKKLTESSSPAVYFKGGSVHCQKHLLAFIFLSAVARSWPAFSQRVFSFCTFFSHSCFIFAVKV